MRALRCMFPVLLSIACGKKVPTDPPPHVPTSPLDARLSLYQELSDSVRDPHGFVETDACDSLLFTSLASFHKAIDIRAAFDSATGQWHRTPAQNCYANYLVGLEPSSKSTISRDMLLGLLWYAWIHQDRSIPESIYSYAIEHLMVMGDGVPSRTLMSTALLATTAQMIYRLGGTDHAERNFPVTWLPGAVDFERHVQTWHILLRMRLYTEIEESAPTRLKSHAESQPTNPLYQYAVGLTDAAIQLLLDESKYPADRLPTTADRCEEWLIQRDTDSAPCPEENKTHSGGEVLSLGYLISKGL